jgi:hypothetical protein
MPPLAIVTPQERRLDYERRQALKKHSSWAVKNVYHRENRMVAWEAEKRRIEKTHMETLKHMIEDRKRAEKEAMAQIQKEKKERNARIQATRRSNATARKASAGTPRRSSRRRPGSGRSRRRSRGRSRSRSRSRNNR